MRSEAIALVYLLWRMNQEEANNFNRAKLQSTIAVSKMAGEGDDKEKADEKRDWSHIETALAAVRPRVPPFIFCFVSLSARFSSVHAMNELLMRYRSTEWRNANSLVSRSARTSTHWSLVSRS